MPVLDINAVPLVVGDAVVVQYHEVLQLDDANGTVILKAPDGHTVIAEGAQIEKHATSIATAIAAAAGVTPHAPTHEDGGGDDLDVTQLAGYPGGTTDFLRADGSFATPPSGGGPHAATHEPGGADPMTVDAAAAVGSLRTLGTGATQAAAGTAPAAAAAAAVAAHDADGGAHPGTFDAAGTATSEVAMHNGSAFAHPGEFEPSGAVSAHDADAGAHSGTFDAAGTAAAAVAAHDGDGSAHSGTFDLAGTATSEVATHDADLGAHSGTFDLTGTAATAVAAHAADPDAHLPTLADSFLFREDFLNGIGPFTFTSGGTPGIFQGSAAESQFVTANHQGNVYLYCGGGWGETPVGDEFSILHLFEQGMLVGGVLVFEWLIMFRGIEGSPGTNSYGVYRIGLIDTLTRANPTDGVYFEFNPGSSSTINRWCANNGSGTGGSTGVTPVANTWYLLRAEVNAAATSVAFSINGASVGSVAADIPTGAGRSLGLGCQVFPVSVGGTSLSNDVGLAIDGVLAYRTAMTRY